MLLVLTQATCGLAHPLLKVQGDPDRNGGIARKVKRQQQGKFSPCHREGVKRGREGADPVDGEPNQISRALFRLKGRKPGQSAASASGKPPEITERNGRASFLPQNAGGIESGDLDKIMMGVSADKPRQES